MNFKELIEEENQLTKQIKDIEKRLHKIKK